MSRCTGAVCLHVCIHVYVMCVFALVPFFPSLGISEWVKVGICTPRRFAAPMKWVEAKRRRLEAEATTTSTSTTLVSGSSGEGGPTAGELK